MKWLIRGFFKTIRALLGPVMLLGELIMRPKPPRRSDEDQAALDELTRDLTLYEFRTCPFCVKTRLAIARLGLNIRRVNAQSDPEVRQRLQEATGTVQVPTLHIHGSGQDQWMLESTEIIAWLEQLTKDAGAGQEA